MIEWVRQEEPWGCIVATSAMILGITYQEARAELISAPIHEEPPDFQTSGVSQIHQQWIFGQHGFYERIEYIGWHATRGQNGEWITKPNDRWPIEPFAPIHYAQVQQGATGNAHSVVMLANGVVLDPMRPGEYKLTDWPSVNHIVGLVRPL